MTCDPDPAQPEGSADQVTRKVHAALDRVAGDMSRIGIAFSGGGDSTALMHLARDWARGRHLMVATVDHGLRAESAAEAVLCHRAAAGLGLPHATLLWQRGTEAGNLMAAARDARLRLLSGWAARNRLEAVLLGHTQDDQAETVLMRLARGSGVDGLAGMAPRRDAFAMTWLRPMLEVSRAELRDWLESRGIGWLDDPSNDNSDYDRVRIRKADAALAHIPVIFMTGLSETADVVEGFECGGVDYVVKPIRAQEVLARLHTHARNARITRMARDAVDVAGMGVVFVDARGRIAWRSPQAGLWLQSLGEARAPGLLPRSLEAALVPGATLAVSTAAGARLSVRNLGAAALGETMLLFALQREGVAGAGGASSSRLADAALTPRETEVLSWLAKGKTNRDIGEILGTSPRTVNKHLEHIFEKLGVETRAAAAALASGQFD